MSCASSSCSTPRAIGFRGLEERLDAALVEFQTRLGTGMTRESPEIVLYAQDGDPRFFIGASGNDGQKWTFCFHHQIVTYQVAVCFTVEQDTDGSWLVTVEATLTRGDEVLKDTKFTFRLTIGHGDGVTEFLSADTEDGVAAQDFWECIKKRCPHCLVPCIAGPTNPACWACVAACAIKCLL